MDEILPLSVIICTYNRANLLKLVLESLTNQTLSRDKYEIIVIDDGSSDNTEEIVEPYRKVLSLKYLYQKNAGLASAKNHGLYASRGKILLFLDDDDIATPSFLDEHVKTHLKYPEDHYAVLNYTTWAPNLSVTPLMHFVTEVGCFLFSYPHIKHGDVLDYTYFWGGRSSCKRSFLIEHGVFNPVFRFGCEDIELGYRLSHHGLKVVYNSKAIGMMTRLVAFDNFCQRLIKQGRSQYIFSTLHNNLDVQKYTEVIGAEENWNNIKPIYEAKIRSAKELDKVANIKLKYSLGLDDLTRGLLHQAYMWAFKACKIKGIIEAKEEIQQKALADQCEKIPDTSSAFSCNGNRSCARTELLRKDEDTASLVTDRITSYEDYKKYVSDMQSEYVNREQYERSFIRDLKPFAVEGYCRICKKNVKFFVDYSFSYEINGILTPNWRERLVCPKCGLNNRMRVSIHLFEQILRPDKKSRIYILEQITPLYKWFVNNYSNVIGSEYLGEEIPSGKMNIKGIRNENITKLSFLDNQFDFVLSFDVFEHIPNFQKAFRECFRVLKPFGSLFFTVPFELNSGKNIVRAVMKDNGEIEYLLPPEYHGDPISSEGCLAFYHFGWEMFSQLKETGFTNVSAYLYWSKELGYLGGEQAVFVAEKSSGQVS